MLIVGVGWISTWLWISLGTSRALLKKIMYRYIHAFYMCGRTTCITPLAGICICTHVCKWKTVCVHSLVCTNAWNICIIKPTTEIGECTDIPFMSNLDTCWTNACSGIQRYMFMYIHINPYTWSIPCCLYPMFWDNYGSISLLSGRGNKNKHRKTCNKGPYAYTSTHI